MQEKTMEKQKTEKLRFTKQIKNDENGKIKR